MLHRQRNFWRFWPPFSRLRQLAGLASWYRLISAARPSFGTVARDSAPRADDGGTVNLPAVPPIVSPSAPMRILVVEDDKVNQLVVTGMLRQMSHHGDCVADGIEALSALVKQSYDVVLMDVRMPNMDGIEAARRIRRMAGPVACVPIIALTANATPHERSRCSEAGMNDFMSKPFRRAELQAKLARWYPRPCGEVDGARPPGRHGGEPPANDAAGDP